jgi:hypothetical protein
MSMRDDGTGDPLDALIDDTARSLTAAAPPASLRARVRARIERPRPGWRVPVWQVSAAAAAVAVLIAVWTVSGPSPGPGSARPEAPVVAVAPPGASPPAVSPPRVARPERATPPRVERAAVEPVPVERALEIVDVVAAGATDGEVVIEPLAIEPLATEPLDLELMETPMPLRAERIEIDPIVVQ